MVTVTSICLVALLAAEGSCHLAEVRKLSGLEYSQEHVLPLETPQKSIVAEVRRSHRPLFSWEDVGGNDTSAPINSSATIHKHIKHQPSHRAEKTSNRRGKNKKRRGRRKEWTVESVKNHSGSQQEVGKRGRRKQLMKVEKETHQLKERISTDLKKRRKFKIKEKAAKTSTVEGERKERVKKRREKHVTKPKKRNKKKQRNETAEGSFENVSDGKLPGPPKSKHHAKNFSDGVTTMTTTVSKQSTTTAEESGTRPPHKGSNLLGNELPAPTVKEEKIGETFKAANDNALFPFHFPSPERNVIASETSTNHSHRHKGDGKEEEEEQQPASTQNKIPTVVVNSSTTSSLPRTKLRETVTEQTPGTTDGDVTSSTAATSITETKDGGDLSCLKNAFLPAPEVDHAVVKYTRAATSSGSSYLIAEYECDFGYRLGYSGNYSMVCSNREWIGTVPKCISNSVEVVNRIPCHKGRNVCDQVCEVIEGNVTCSCYKGFRLHGNSCKDIDECEFANGGCEHECRNTMGAFMCLCPPGLRLADDNRHCTDVNECLLRNGHGPCQDQCRNEWGGYACSCEGIPGTKLSADNHTCEDVDECADGSAGCSHSCLNTLGSAFCLCPAGFMLASDWKTCQDIDECEYEDLQTEHCDLRCVNTIGSYHCLEPQDEGRSDPIVNCLPGYRPGHENSCVDIDECLEHTAGCSHRCLNTLGSFLCMCHRGYALAPDKKTCIDDSIRDVCPPLDIPPHGYMKCDRHPIRTKRRTRFINHAGTVCDLHCPQGYRKEGDYRKVCGLNHRWEGPDNGSCVRLPNHILYRVK